MIYCRSRISSLGKHCSTHLSNYLAVSKGSTSRLYSVRTFASKVGANHLPYLAGAHSCRPFATSSHSLKPLPEDFDDSEDMSPAIVSDEAEDYSAMDMDSDGDFSDDMPSTSTKAKTAKTATKKTPAPATTAAKKRKTAALPGAVDGDRPVEEIYQKKTQLEHILLRPDTYIGSVEKQTQSMWVFDAASQRMINRQLTFVPGLFKIFDEILVNAADNKIRDSSMDTLKVDIDKENCRISISNNGRGIPIELHSKEGVYVPELIFGHLLTSSNYDDAQKKVTGGRNGYGAKLCNIFSREFIVETADSRRHKSYKQVFSANMSKRGEPIIKDYDKEDYTKITFKPDLAKFGMDCLDDDIVALLERRVYDVAGSVANIKVFLNGERIKIRTFKQYVELFHAKPAEPTPEVDSASQTSTSAAMAPSVIVHEKFGDRWEICTSVSDGQFQQMSFVNAICTYKGGTHVNYIADQLVARLMEAIKKKGGKDMANLKPFQVKTHLSLFINCLIENPTFDSQTKENMTLRASAFGSKCDLPEEFIKKVLKSGIVEAVMSSARHRQDQQLKKTDGAKKSRLSGITKLDDANNAGTKNAARCTLILTEGDSAKALAVSGLSVVGRDDFGVFPLRGKLLNVREATHKQIMENAEINHIKQILGLQHGRTYNTVESLRYGHLMIMTDQDHDGSHIKGLIINFLDHFFPSLLKIPGFLVEFITPIVKVTKGRQEKAFFTLPEYEAWKEANDGGRGWSIKYYKGLGTSTAADAKKYFAAMEMHKKQFAPVDTEERQLIDMAFNKKRADERKEWLKTCTATTFVDHTDEVIRLKDFINKELILFSMADNIRSIPSMVDGLKPGHRKILFSCFKRKLRGEIKVAQLVGYVAEHSAYHHGEQSLAATIVGMAQNFVGSNNVNLLEPIGQFGTRLQGGKDAASPRYIFTSLSPFARALYRAEDDALLKSLHEDGQTIEPEWYLPILPMVLVNGGEGIGTGWMTSIPNFNPRDVVANLQRMMRGEEPQLMMPWYAGFRGPIEALSNDYQRYKVSGIWRKTDETTLEITELPIGMWTQTYKEMLEGMLNPSSEKGNTEALIKDYKEYHTDTTVRFVITLADAGLSPEEIEKRFKLSTTITLSNMVCFDAQGRIRRYESPLKILEEFYHIRLDYYAKRKEWLADQLTREWTKLDNRVRFIMEIIDGKLRVQNRPKADIVRDLTERGYAKCDAPSATETSNEAEAADESSDELSKSSGYEYLLTMPIYSLTKERVEKLMKERQEKETELNVLLGKTPKDLWNSDLDEFMVLWNQFESKNNAALEVALSGAAIKGVAKKRAPAKKRDAKSSVSASDVEDEDLFERKPTKAAPAKKAPVSTASQNRNISTASAAISAPKAFSQPLPSTKPVAASAPVAIDPDVLNSLPLHERINYMLNRGKTSTAAPPVKKQSTLDSLLAKPKESTPAITTILEDSDDDLPMAPIKSSATKSTATTKPRAPVKRKPVIQSSASEEEADDDVFELDASDEE